MQDHRIRTTCKIQLELMSAVLMHSLEGPRIGKPSACSCNPMISLEFAGPCCISTKSHYEVQNDCAERSSTYTVHSPVLTSTFTRNEMGKGVIEK